MGFSCFNHVKITGITGVVPEKIINIDDEIQYYDNDVKKLERNKKILGLGTRHVVEDGVTTVDLCEKAAKNLFSEMKIDVTEIDALIVVSTSHDYVYPASSCILQGRLGLSESCTCVDLSGLACSGYVHALFVAHSLVAAQASKRCLVLAGDIASTYTDRRNRLSNMLFGDAAVATLVEYTSNENKAYFVTGARGNDWDKLIAPAGGRKFPIRKDIADIEVIDKSGNVWHLWDDIMRGMDVFKFTMEVGPQSVKDILQYAGTSVDEVDFFALHQANKQIIRTVAQQSGIPLPKVSSDTFSAYGNCATASVATVLCDQLFGRLADKVVLCTFGVGLSWGTCLLNLGNMHNGGINIFKAPKNIQTRAEQTDYWIKYFKGED